MKTDPTTHKAARYFKTALLLLICGVILQGCYTRRQWLAKYPPTITIDTVQWNTVIYRDTTLYDTIYADTVRLTTPVFIQSHGFNPPQISSDTIFADVTFAHAAAWVTGLQLNLQLEQRDSVLAYKLDSIRSKEIYWRTLYRNELRAVPVKQKNRRRVQYFFIGLLAGLFIGLLLILRRR